MRNNHACDQDPGKSNQDDKNHMRNRSNRILTAKQAVLYLGISLSTLNRIEKQGLLVPYRTPGGHRRYDTKMLDEYLEATRRNHAS
jgi:excisionase family DNA binding protein